MSAAKHTYPTDITTLHEMLAEKDQAITQKDNTITQKETYIGVLEESLRLEKLRNFDARSENSGNQQDMFNEAELAEVVEEGSRQYDADDSLTFLVCV